MWRIMRAALDWHDGKHRDGGVEACRTCPAKFAVFAAVEAARAAHLTRMPAVLVC